MEVPQGYKQTSIGLIPEGWKVKRVDEFAPLQRGFDLPINNIVSGNFPVVFSNGILKFHNEFKAKAPGIVTGRSGTIGKVFYITEDYWPHNTSLWVTNFIDSEPKYVYFLFNYLNFNRFGSGSGVPTLNRNDVHPYKIPLPPLPEQQKIAEILSAWDKAIETCQKTIEELRSRNKGLAQQLLSGKISNKNEEDQLKDYHIIGKYVKEVSKRNTALQEKRILSVTNSRGFINQSEQFGRELASADLSNYKIVKKGQFAYNPSRVNVGSLDMLRTFDAGVLSPMYVVFEVTSKDLIPEFLYYHLKTYWFIGHIPMFVQGSVRDTLSFDGFSGMKFYIPTLEEQKKIVTILDAAASELKQYEEKLTNLKLQKKGLMQQLLTGKVRVKI